MKKTPFSIFWFRRDLRIEDNHGFFKALTSGEKILPLFIFDSHILEKLPKNDARVSFIHEQIETLKKIFQENKSDFLVLHGSPETLFPQLLKQYYIKNIYTNTDYEPYARNRDETIKNIIEKNGGNFLSFKDQVIFEKNEVLKKDGTPYTVFTPYSKIWKKNLEEDGIQQYNSEEFLNNLLPLEQGLPIPSLSEMGFEPSNIQIPSKKYELDIISKYDKTRDVPSIKGTSRLGVHLRFGTISIRETVLVAMIHNEIFLSELIWREFYMQILWHFPYVTERSFREKYDAIEWENNTKHFEAWKNGNTGYQLVDAGMRELNTTGYMHNRVRMVTASFLCKHLLIDWRWGEKYFAEKLLDFDLAANNGGWQWSAGTGCDAAPYFRVFNPESQQKKFDPDFEYIKKWVPEFGSFEYPQPIIEHKFARNRAIERYKKGLE